MKKTSDDALKDDVEELLELSVVSEAIRRVEQQWDDALRSLDADSQVMMEQYFEGRTAEELSVHHRVSVPEMENWIARSKRQLSQVLRTRMPVKQ